MADDNEKQLGNTSKSKKDLEELVSVLNYLVFDCGCMKPESNEESEHILKVQFDSQYKENIEIVSGGPCSSVSNWKPGKLSSCFLNKYPNATNQTENSKRLINMYLNADTHSVITDKGKNAPQMVDVSVKREAEAKDPFIDPSLIKRPRRLGNIPFPVFKDKPFVSPMQNLQKSSSSAATNVAGNSNFGNNLFTTATPSNPSNVSQFENRVHLNPDNSVSRGNKQATLSASAEDGNNSVTPNQLPFKSAYELMMINDKAKGIKRTLPTARSVHMPEMLRRTNKSANEAPITQVQKNQTPTSLVENNEAQDAKEVSDNPEVNEIMKHDCMKNVDPKMVEAILNEIVDVSETNWNDIAGLEGVKNTIKEIIIWPMLRPDIFYGLRGPPKGILLFGPPGTGKTMIGRLISTESKSTFFNISASSLTSKWIGDGEKMVRALFQVARVKQPAVIFIDEIDSILTQRSDTEHESSRRMKTEFLIQFDGCGTKSEDRILVIGVTNRPQELDEAARRRLVKRIYIPLPDIVGRQQLVRNLLKDQKCSLSDEDFEKIAELTDGYSGADIRSICHEAAYGPIRDVGHLLEGITADEVRPMLLKDFHWALKHVKSSVATSDLDIYEDWDDKYGCQVSQK